ncbi:MAG TPA: leucyl/phenylalanyl-tRNA--protein transferase [Betaproteobacteria bacterium]|nr:leucyl/phenylalanyl-tRNA--protein transferase [Betaproteobacteria bacterium]
MIPWLDPTAPFPPLDCALLDPNGLLAAGADLSTERLLGAYSRGIFPWFNQDEPVLWWSPDPRMVLFPAELKVSRSLRKRLRRRDYEIRADTAFHQVMIGCAAPRRDQESTWISPMMIKAYTQLHRLGAAHSVETWIDGELAGGLYGVSLGRVFYGESMFSRVSDASKIAFVHLARQLARWEFGLIDCQMKTAHLASLGARDISRQEFSRRLAVLVNYPGITGHWQFDHDLIA